MLIAQPSSFIFLTNGEPRRHGLAVMMAKRRDFSEKSKKKEQPISPIRVSNAVLARSGIAVLGLGFIDAGYSGDWSRIGVISTETEFLLKVAAFVVVPLCFFLAFSFTDDPNA